jgi:phenylacetate-CoA ligase
MNPALYSGLQYLLRATKRRDVLREYTFQKKLRRSPVAVSEAYSREQAVKYANHIANVSAGYRKRLADAGIDLPVTDDKWLSLPTLRKTDYQQEPAQWFCDHPDKDTLEWSCTSGSTGEPYQFPQDPDSCLAESISKELFLKTCGWRPGFKEAVFKMELAPMKGSRKLLRKLSWNQPISFSAVKFKAEHAPGVLAEMKKQGTQFLRGYSSALVLLEEAAKSYNLHCHIPIIQTFGEGLSKHQQETIEEVFGGKVYRDYGGSEAMHIGFECPARTGYHLDLARFRVEVLDGDRPVNIGETGEIVVTCFRNPAMPFVRYRMGDLGTLADPNEPCPCGNKFPRLSAIQGRINEQIYTPTGRFVNVLFFVYVLEFAYKDMAGFRIIQTEKDRLEILWIPRHDRAAECLPELERQIRERTDNSMKIIWKAVSEIPADDSGKRRILVPLRV